MIAILTVDQLVEAFRFLADQQGTRQGCLEQMAQQQANIMSSGGGRSKDKHWSDIGLYKNVRLFAGDPASWINLRKSSRARSRPEAS